MYNAYDNSNCSGEPMAFVYFTTLPTPPTPPSLTASSIGTTTATLTIANHTDAWYYKSTTTGQTTCQGPVAAGTSTASLTGLTGNTSYVYSAYSDSGCTTANLLATAASFTTSGVSVSNLSETGTRSLYVDNLPFAQAFTTGSASNGYTLRSVTFVLTDVESNAGTLTVSLRQPDSGNSANPASSALATLDGTNPTAAGTYTFTCATGCDLAKDTTYFIYMVGSTADDFTWKGVAGTGETTEPANNGWSLADKSRYKLTNNNWADGSGVGTLKLTATVTPSLTASSITSTGATLTIANHTDAWYYKSTTTGQTTCQGPVAAGTSTKALTGLTAGTSYVYSAYSASGCADTDKIATASSFTTPISVSNLSEAAETSGISMYSDFPRLAQAFSTGSNSGGYTLKTATVYLHRGSSQTLTVTLHAAASNGNDPSGNALVTLASGAYATGEHTFTCSGSGCDLDASTTYVIQLAAGGDTNARYEWRAISTTNEAKEPGTNGWSIGNRSRYYRASNSTWNDEVVGATAALKLTATVTPSLIASSITSTGATLTISGHTAGWYYKETHPSTTATCSAVSAGTSTATLTLTADKTYAYGAYSNSTCTSALGDTVYFSTTDVAVGNLAEARNSNRWVVGSANNVRRANAFTTGSHSAGYTLAAVTLDFAAKTNSPGDISVALHAADTGNSSNPAATAAATLTGSDPDAAGLQTYTCSGSGCDLSASTTYFIVASVPTGYANGYYEQRYTSSDDEALQSAAGWSIANAGRFKAGAAAWGAATGAASMHVAANQKTSGGSVTATGVTATGATLSVPNHTGAWYYSISGGSGSGAGGASAAGGPSCVGPINGAASLSQLNSNTTYTVTAWANGCGGEALATGEFATIQQSASLTLERVHATSAVLDFDISQITYHWYYKADTGPHSATCSAGVNVHHDAHVGGLTPLTQYTYRAYTDANCNTEAASITFTTLRVDLDVSNLTAGSVTLTPNPAHWSSTTTYYLKGTTLAGCEPYTGSANAIRLWPRSQFTFEMHSTSSCNDSPHLGYAEIVGPYAPLTATHVSANSATLELGGWTQRDWYYKRTEPSGDNTCHRKDAGDTTITLTGLQPNTQYSYWVIRSSDCAAENSLRATNAPGITFTTVSMAASEPGATTATITLNGGQHGRPWWYAETGMNPSYPSGQPFQSNCHYGGTSKSGGSSVVVGDLVPGNGNSSKPYTFTAYSDAACSVARAMGSVNASTLSPTLRANTLSGGGARLTLGNWGANDPGWHYRVNVVVPGSRNIVLHGPDGCISVTGGALQTDVASLPTLSGYGAYYIFTAHWESGCHYSTTAAYATLSGPSATPSLSASGVTQTGAALTIANHPGTWYYKADTGPDAACQGPVHAATETLTGLTANTPYTYTAYSDSGCSTLLATAPSFTTST